METSATDLFAAIESGSKEGVETLLETLTTEERQNLLQRRIDGSTPIERAFALGEKDIGLLLAQSILPSSILEEIRKYTSQKVLQPTQRALFMTFKHYFSVLKNGRRISAKELATKMAFLKPLCFKFNISYINDREILIKIALLLGVAYDPQELCRWILWNRGFLKRKKADLVDWLIANKFLAQDMQPLSVAEYGKIIKKGYYEHLQIFMTRFPNWVNTTDARSGRNVLDFVIPRPMKRLNRFMDDIKLQFGAEMLMELLCQSSYISVCPACFTIYSEFHGNSIRFRKEIMIAILECFRTSALTQYIGSSLLGSFHMLLYHTLPSYQGSPRVIFAAQSAFKAKVAEVSRMSAEHRVGSEKEFPIYDLPADLIHDIARLLEPMDFLTIFKLNKRMATLLRETKNNKFWQSYHDAHFPRDFGPKVISYAANVIQKTKGTYNWRRDQYVKIELAQMTPVTMDENWLILMSKENDQHVLWNCHSQERLFPLPNETCERPVALMTNYSVGDMPSYMSYDYAAEKYSLRRGRDYFSLKNLLAPDLGPCRNIHPIDNRILAHGIIYDTETDQVVAKSSFAYQGHDMVYNPYSKTFLVYSPNKLDVCDLDGNVIQTFKSHITGEQQLALVDEHTICLANQMHYFDLRTGRSYRLWDKDRLLDVAAISPQRVLYRDRQVDIVVSWHLASSTWEFASLFEPVPMCLNSRYIATHNTEDQSTVIYDYCPK